MCKFNKGLSQTFENRPKPKPQQHSKRGFGLEEWGQFKTLPANNGHKQPTSQHQQWPLRPTSENGFSQLRRFLNPRHVKMIAPSLCDATCKFIIENLIQSDLKWSQLNRLVFNWILKLLKLITKLNFLTVRAIHFESPRVPIKHTIVLLGFADSKCIARTVNRNQAFWASKNKRIIPNMRRTSGMLATDLRSKLKPRLSHHL